MITKLIRNSNLQNVTNQRNKEINCLLESRKLHSIETLQYERSSVCSTDLDPTGNFLLIGLSNGTVDLQGIEDPLLGSLDQMTHFNFGTSNNLHRVQWCPRGEQFFSMLDNNNLSLVDPQGLRVIDKFNFKIKTYWSEWSVNDKRMIAVCGNESQTRLVDLRSGSSVQTIILGAKSGLASHRASRCLWSKQDTHCLIVGDNEGYIHVYDTRQSSKPLVWAGSSDVGGQISGMSFKSDDCSLITSHGTDNRLVEWTYDKCLLIANVEKFKKKEKIPSVETIEKVAPSGSRTSQQDALFRKNNSKRPCDSSMNESKGIKKKKTRYLSMGALLRCQFYVTERNIYCPVPYHSKKSKEFYIYNSGTGERIKTIKSDNILSQGVYSITGLFPDSFVLYVGGSNRLRVWTIDEDYGRKLNEKMQKYHTTRWDSDDE